MILLRLFGFVVAVAVGASILLYVFTGQRRWLKLAWNSFRFGLLVAVAVLLIFALERLIEGL